MKRLKKYKAPINEVLNLLQSQLDKIAELGLVGLDDNDLSTTIGVVPKLRGAGFENAAQNLQSLVLEIQRQNFKTAMAYLVSLSNWNALFTHQFSLLTLTSGMVIESESEKGFEEAVELFDEVNLLIRPLTAVILSTEKVGATYEQQTIKWICSALKIPEYNPFGLVQYQDQIKVQTNKSGIPNYANSIHSHFFKGSINSYDRIASSTQLFSHVAYKQTGEYKTLISVLNTSFEYIDILTTKEYLTIMEADERLDELVLSKRDGWMWEPGSLSLLSKTSNVSPLAFTSELVAKQVFVALEIGKELICSVASCDLFHCHISEANVHCGGGGHHILSFAMAGYRIIPELDRLFLRPKAEDLAYYCLDRLKEETMTLELGYKVCLLTTLLKKRIRPVDFELEGDTKKYATNLYKGIIEGGLLTSDNYFMLLSIILQLQLHQGEEEILFLLKKMLGMRKPRKKETWIRWLANVALLVQNIGEDTREELSNTLLNEPFLNHFKTQHNSLENLLTAFLQGQRSEKLQNTAEGYLNKAKKKAGATPNNLVDTLNSVELFVLQRLLNLRLLNQGEEGLFWIHIGWVLTQQVGRVSVEWLCYAS